MMEVEILVQVFEDDKDVVLEKLKKFDFKGVKAVEDTYFYDPLRPTLQPNKQGSLRSCFRLRNKDGKYHMTFKNDNYEEDTWLYSDEHEIEISDIKEAEDIFRSLGLKKLVEIHNKKYTFLTPDYEIVFEDVDNLGHYLEVELLHEINPANVKQTKAEIWEFIKSLGLKVSEEVKIGKPELMLQKKGIAEQS